MPFRRRRHPIAGLLEDRPLVVAFVLVLTAGILAGFAWWWADGGSSRATDDPRVMELFDAGKKLEDEYLSIAAVRDPGEEDIALLGRAVENQRNWMRAVGGNDPEQLARLRQMETTFEAARARVLSATSRRNESEARAELEAGRSAAALPKLEAALEAQRELNRGHPRAEYRDLPRESQLAQEVEALRAEPLAESLAAAAARAGSAAAAGRNLDAVAAWREARDAQTRINREFPRTRHADLSRLDRIDAEIDTLMTEASAARVAELQRLATDASARGKVAEAAAFYGEAVDLQGAINTWSPRSRHVSAERLELLEVERQTALGASLAARIVAIDRALTEALAAGDVATAVNRINEGGRAMDELASLFPRSRQADPGVRLKFNYLTTQRDSIATTLEQVRGSLVPVPGRPGVSMLGTEVPQDLYQRLMNANPSREAGPSMPVDSVNWNDAQEFCRRIGWLIGHDVRLPTEDEFRAAAGEPASGPDGLVWRPAVSDLRSRRVSDGPANEAGFRDLLGNVAEWLDAAGASDSDSAPVAGGSFSDVPDPAGSLPITIRARTDRSRSTGFRFVVER